MTNRVTRCGNTLCGYHLLKIKNINPDNLFSRTSFSSSRDREPSAPRSPSPGRGRLEVQSIRVRPQLDLADVVDEGSALDDAGSDPGVRRNPARSNVLRNRQRQRQRQRGGSGV
jgi:hypothetical protein